MTDTHPAKFTKLVILLRELFRLDQPDLDFGIYRILHANSGEVTQFLDPWQSLRGCDGWLA